MSSLSKNNICLSCNLCCSQPNETIHLFDKEYELFDVKDITSYEGQDFTHSVTFDGGGCTNLTSNGICRVYDKRPYTCRTFECGVLVKYKTGEYDYDKSKRLIQLVKNGDQKVWREEFEKDSISPKTVMKKT